MALELRLQYIDNLKGKSNRFGRLSFRDYIYDTKVLPSSNGSVCFSETYRWPLGTPLTGNEILRMTFYNKSKFGKSFIGEFSMLLQSLILDYQYSGVEELIDGNQQLLRTCVAFDLTYVAPDGSNVKWRDEEFEYPLLDAWTENENDAITADGEGNIMNAMSALAEPEDGELSPDEDEGPSLLKGHTKKPLKIEPTMDKISDFQISISVEEGRNFHGANINPSLILKVGEDKQYSQIIRCTNNPYFAEYFVFDFKMTKAQLFDQVIQITAIATGRSIPGIRRGQKIGVFKMDVGTVFAAPDHMFPNKWAVLIDPDDVGAGPKGYLKCSIMIIGRGEPVKSIPKTMSSDDLDDIEENILLPIGMSKERQMAQLEVRIHKAEDLPQMTTDMMASVRKAFIGDSHALIDPLVQVSFAGHTAKTKTIKKNYKPEWNQKFIFEEVFPPLCNRIKIQILDDDTVKKDIVATHFLPLNEISNSGEYGFMPMFGPSWLNFYGAPRGTSLSSKEKELNCGLGEGAAYRGRLLLSIKTQLCDEDDNPTTGVSIESTNELSEKICGVREPFTLFFSLFDASMIDKSIIDLKKPIHFEISMGNSGNTLDSTSWGYQEAPEILDPSKPVLEAPCVSTTPPMFAVSKDNISYYLPLEGDKPCMFVTAWYEDCRKRLYNQNCLDDIADSLSEYIAETKELKKKKVPTATLR